MRPFLIAVIVGMLASQPVKAEIDFRKDPDAKVDLGMIEGCIGKADTWETARECAGLTYENCISRVVGNVTRGHESACLFRELDLWLDIYHRDALLKEAWSIQKDYQMRGAYINRYDAHKTFQEMEAAWQDYLQSQCDYQMLKWGSGTIVTTDFPYCQIELVAERILWIRNVPDIQIIEKIE
jgi:hypothetical protein